MIELTPREYDSQEYDIDGSTTYADLKINNMVIPLGEENLNNLFETVEEFKTKYTFCYQCKYYTYNKGVYRGSCLKQAENADKTMDSTDYGYLFSVGNSDWCTNGEKKIDK